MARNQHSIRRKLISKGLRITALALSILMAGTLIFDTLGKYQTLINTAYVDAEIIGGNSAAAIMFGDKGDAGEVLATLSATHNVLHAALFLPDGSRLAEYIYDQGAPCQIMDTAHHSDGHNLHFDWCRV